MDWFMQGEGLTDRTEKGLIDRVEGLINSVDGRTDRLDGLTDSDNR